MVFNMDYLSDKLPFSPKVLATLATDAKDYALNKGVAMWLPGTSADSRVPLPLCLRPSPFPSYWFNYALSIQSDINFVLHKVAHDYSFLKECLQSTIEVDTFTSQIFEIYKTVLEEGPAQTMSLGLFRSDYMLDTKGSEDGNGNEKQITLKQVEINTISSGFAGVAPEVSNLHRCILNSLDIKVDDSQCPKNNALALLAAGMISAWEAYGQSRAVILFVVEDKVYNICDQRALEYAINQQNNSVLVVRSTFSDIRQRGVFKDKRLYIDGKEVAVIYYRTGYIPDLYEPEDWDLRLMMERSLAIKCPSAHYHLAGTKKVQQVLSQPGILEKFLTDTKQISRLQQVFCRQYTLNLTAEGDQAAAMASDNPENFVMKPQREGGGNNIYGNDITATLQRIGSGKERQGYILMERINPPQVPNYILRKDVIPDICNVVNELGIYGVILGNKEKIVVNKEAGFLMRSKEVGSNEGGISAGYGALDSPFLMNS